MSEENSSETIVDIQNLQSIELELFNTLETGLTNGTLTVEQQNNIVEQINKISNMRISLYETLDKMYNYFSKNVNNTETVMGEQMTTIIIIENELNEAKIRLKKIEDDKNNKLRLVEINTYYSEKYNDHSHIMKIIVFFCVLIIIVTVLSNKGIIKPVLFKYLIIIIIFIAIIVLWKNISLSMMHDNMNYQEYNWGGAPSTMYDTSNPNGANPWTGLGETCIAQECCQSGFTYVPSPINKCVSNSLLPEGVSPYVEQTTSETTNS